MFNDPPRLTPIIRERIQSMIDWLDGGGDDAIKDLKLQFRMEAWNDLDPEDRFADVTLKPADFCGTPACIGGFAEVQARLDTGFMDMLGDIPGVVRHADYVVMRWLNIRADAFSALCMGHGVGLEAIGGDTKWAARTLRHLLATGVVDWFATRPLGSKRTMEPKPTAAYRVD